MLLCRKTSDLIEISIRRNKLRYIWEGVKQLGLKFKKMKIIKSSVCLLQRSNFLLKKTKDKDFKKINNDFIKVFINQID